MNFSGSHKTFTITEGMQNLFQKKKMQMWLNYFELTNLE